MPLGLLLCMLKNPAHTIPHAFPMPLNLTAYSHYANTNPRPY